MKVSFKTLIVLSVLVAALFMFVQPHQALAQSKFKLTFQATWPAGSTLYANFVMFAEQVKKMSGGRLEIEDGEGGGTVATVLLPLTEAEPTGGTTNGD